jgi:hypothetical protein
MHVIKKRSFAFIAGYPVFLFFLNLGHAVCKVLEHKRHL